MFKNGMDVDNVVGKLWIEDFHLELGRQWKVIAFHMLCVDRRIRTILCEKNIEVMYINS
jgi:hypothetical protein